MDLAARQFGLGGSDAGPVCGVGRFKSRLELYLEKRGELPPKTEENDFMFWGKQLEPIVARRYQDKSGNRVRRSATIYSPQYDFLFYNPDRLISKKGRRGSGILEIKCLDDRHHPIKELTDLHDEYFLQVQHGFLVTGLEWGEFALLLGGNRFETFEIEPDKDMIKTVEQIEVEFWEKHILAGVPPEVDGSQSCSEVLKRLHPKDDGQTIELLSEDCVRTFNRMRELEEEMDALGKEKATCENWLKWRIGTARFAKLPEYQITYSSTKDSTVTMIDEEKLKLDYADAYKACTIQAVKPGHRRFSYKKLT